jgi:hypothetical protein
VPVCCICRNGPSPSSCRHSCTGQLPTVSPSRTGVSLFRSIRGEENFHGFPLPDVRTSKAQNSGPSLLARAAADLQAGVTWSAQLRAHFFWWSWRRCPCAYCSVDSPLETNLGRVQKCHRRGIAKMPSLQPRNCAETTSKDLSAVFTFAFLFYSRRRPGDDNAHRSKSIKIITVRILLRGSLC